VQGLLFSTNDCLPQPTDLVRLWMHESQRVYGDKLVDEKDIETYSKIQVDIIKKNFEVSTSEVRIPKTFFLHAEKYQHDDEMNF
jgi:hypothetical protein